MTVKGVYRMRPIGPQSHAQNRAETMTATGERPVEWHSELTPRTRARNWAAVASGAARAVVGARSALFLPYADLGLIVVDEEHDQAYKQEDGTHYHARDMAVVRGHIAKIPVVLASATPSVESEVNALRASLNEVNRLESRRRKKVEALRMKAKEDDVNPALLREAARLERELPMQPLVASQFESFFDERLRKYDVDEADIKKEEAEQDRLLSRVREVNTSFQTAKRGDTSSKERETALQNLENAYMAYKEILRNLDTGRKFYNDLAAITTRFRDECRNFVYARRSEAQNLETDLADSMAGLRIQQTNQPTPLGPLEWPTNAQTLHELRVPCFPRGVEERYQPQYAK